MWRRGIIVTNDTKIYNKLLLLRNHGEVVIDDPKFKINKKLLTNLIGYNYRLSEIHAAIAYEQVKKLIFTLKIGKELLKHFLRA